MAAFPGRARFAVVDAAVQNNAGAYAGSDRGIENVAKSAGSAPPGFGESGGVRVVVHLHGHAILRSDFFREREVAPAAQIGWIEDYAGLRVQGSGRADPDALKFVAGRRRG